jgi:hypothetical protein
MKISVLTLIAGLALLASCNTVTPDPTPPAPSPTPPPAASLNLTVAPAQVTASSKTVNGVTNMVASFTSMTLSATGITGSPTVTLEDASGNAVTDWTFVNPCFTAVSGTYDCSATFILRKAVPVAAGTYNFQLRAVVGAYQKTAALSVIVP